MPVIVLDTNVISELMRPQPDQGVLAWANSLDPESAAITAMNEAEILHGLARLPDGRRKQALYESWDALAADQSLDHPMSEHPVKRRKKLIEVAIPLEAQRLGLEAYASDLNPVAVLINKAKIEIPPKFAGMPPVNPEARSKKQLIDRTVGFMPDGSCSC